MDTLENRLIRLYGICTARRIQMHLSVNGTYGRFEIYFDPSHQGLDPIPQITSNSLLDVIEQAEKYLEKDNEPSKTT